MPISTQILAQWHRRGQKQGLVDTRGLVMRSLERRFWPEGTFDCKLYHQGSYANKTYIRSGSDIDMVIELREPLLLGAIVEPARFRLFRRQLLRALRGSQADGGINSIENRSKAIKVHTAHLKADVLAAQQANSPDGSECIVFWPNDSDVPMVNYPRQHHFALRQKGGVAPGLKPAIRMFKHARELILKNHGRNYVIAPSYFIECLIWNAPNHLLRGSVDRLFEGTLNWISDVHPSELWMPHGRSMLIRPDQWPDSQYRDYVRELVSLWNEPG